MATDETKVLTLLGLYKAVAIELDKPNVASYDLEQFNYYGRKGQLKYFQDRMSVYDVTKKLTEDLRSMKVSHVYTPTSALPLLEGQRMALPAAFNSVELVTAWFAAPRKVGPFVAGKPFRRPVKRLTADMEGFTEAPNHYLQASYDNVFYRIVGGELEILSGTHAHLQLVKVELQYLRTPPELELTPEHVEDLLTDRSPVLRWPVTCTYDLVGYIVRELMEQHGNQRLTNYAAMNQPSVGPPPSAPAAAGQSRQAAAPAAATE